MNKSICNFKELCPELTNEERQSVDDYLNYFCIPGEQEFSYNYFYRLYWLASRSKSKKIVELGCIPGASTMALMWAINRIDGLLYSCDIEDPPEMPPFSLNMDVTRRVRVPRTSAIKLAQSWGNGPVDMIYLDTSHSYNETCEEIAAWLPHLKEGGLFVFHDTEVYKHSVLLSIMEMMIKNNKLFEFHHFPDVMGHGVLQWYSGVQLNTFIMRPSETKDVVSLTYLLTEAKNNGR